MKELDVVKLRESYQDIPQSIRGIIVIGYNSKECEVEFFDEEGYTIDVITVPQNKLIIVWEYGKDN